MRPASIITFERCYIGAWVLGLVNLAIGWNGRMAAMSPQAQGMLGSHGMVGVLLAGLLVGSLITWVLWYFVARRASTVAKWILVALFVIGLLELLSGFIHGTFVLDLGGVLTLVSWILQAIAVAMLFRPDARAWFAAPLGLAA